MSRHGFLVVRWHFGLMSTALLISAFCTRDLSRLHGGCMDQRPILNLLNQPVEWQVLTIFIEKIRLKGKENYSIINNK